MNNIKRIANEALWMVLDANDKGTIKGEVAVNGCDGIQCITFLDWSIEEPGKPTIIKYIKSYYSKELENYKSEEIHTYPLSEFINELKKYLETCKTN